MEVEGTDTKLGNKIVLYLGTTHKRYPAVRREMRSRSFFLHRPQWSIKLWNTSVHFVSFEVSMVDKCLPCLRTCPYYSPKISNCGPVCLSSIEFIGTSYQYILSPTSNLPRNTDQQI